MIGYVLRLRRAARIAAALPTKAALLTEIERLAAADGRIVRANALPAIVLAVLALLVAAWRASLQHDGQALLAGLVALAAAALPVAAFAARRRFIDAVLAQAAMLDRGLVAVACDGRALWREWSARFPDLRRGDEGQLIDRVVDGEWTDAAGGTHALRCFRLCWVEVSSNTRTDAEGRSHSEERRTTHWRHGVVVALQPPLVLGVSAVRRPQMPVAWSTAAIEFEERWRAGAASQMQAARLLTPTVVQAFVETGGRFKALDLHFDGDQGCIGFADDDLLARADAARRSDRVDELRWRVRSSAAMPKLEALTTLLRVLADAAADLPPRRS